MRQNSYSIVEPHPQVSTHYVQTGRGGAGNFARVPTSISHGDTASGPASRVALSPKVPSAYYTTGRGGAGNLYREKERPMFSFDEELEQQTRVMENSAPVYHIGRGGQGNLVDERRPSQSARQGSSASAISADSNGSKTRKSFENAWDRVSSGIRRASNNY